MTEVNAVDYRAVDDDRLVGLSREGDRAAFNELWSRHSGVAVSVVRRLAGADAEDMVSEAFTQVWEQLQRGKGPSSGFRSYLLTVARNLCAKNYRKQGRVVYGADLDPVADHSAVLSPEVLSELRDEHSSVLRAFRLLPERQQQVLWLLFVEGVPRGAVAEYLELSPNAVSALVKRAKESLRVAWLECQVPVVEGTEHPEVARLIPRFTRGVLSASKRQAVRDHLGDCGACALVHDRVRRENRVLAGAGGVVAVFIAAVSSAGLTGASVGVGVAATVAAVPARVAGVLKGFLGKGLGVKLVSGGAVVAVSVGAGVAVAAGVGLTSGGGGGVSNPVPAPGGAGVELVTEGSGDGGGGFDGDARVPEVADMDSLVLREVATEVSADVGDTVLPETAPASVDDAVTETAPEGKDDGAGTDVGAGEGVEEDASTGDGDEGEDTGDSGREFSLNSNIQTRGGLYKPIFSGTSTPHDVVTVTVGGFEAEVHAGADGAWEFDSSVFPLWPGSHLAVMNSSSGAGNVSFTLKGADVLTVKYNVGGELVKVDERFSGEPGKTVCVTGDGVSSTVTLDSSGVGVLTFMATQVPDSFEYAYCDGSRYGGSTVKNW